MSQVIVRDVRKGSFRVDDAFIDTFATFVGSYAILAYVALCRHANKSGEAWPSHELIAEEMGNVSKPTVIKAIRTLEAHNIIQVQRSKNELMRQSVNVYVLTDKAVWSVKASRVNHVDAEPGKRRLPSRVNEPGKPRLLEGYTRKETHLKEEKPNRKSPESPSIIGTLDAVRSRLADRGIVKRKAI